MITLNKESELRGKLEEIGYSGPVELGYLVRACGISFWALENTNQNKFFAHAFGDKKDFKDRGPSTEGDSPEEAVANLLVELRKNK